jgi:aryl-alcohol dehydrogenase-like predicted oxidoreductase
VGDESEKTLGEWFASRKNRDKIVLATKVGFDRKGVGAGLKKEQIEYWIDESLKNLKTDYVDIYYAHTDDKNTPLEETMEAFDSLVKKGKVRILGGSNYDTWKFAEANFIAKEKDLTPYTVMQQRFTYLYTKAEVAPKYEFNETVNRERMRFLKAKGIPLVAYSSLAKGGYENEARLPADTIAGERLEVLKKMAKEKGVCASAMAVAWMCNLSSCGYTDVIPLFGSSSVEHFTENLKGAFIELTKEEMEILTNA